MLGFTEKKSALFITPVFLYYLLTESIPPPVKFTRSYVLPVNHILSVNIRVGGDHVLLNVATAAYFEVLHNLYIPEAASIHSASRIEPSIRSDHLLAGNS